MNVHKNAHMTPHGRLQLVRRVRQEGWRLTSVAQKRSSRRVLRIPPGARES